MRNNKINLIRNYGPLALAGLIAVLLAGCTALPARQAIDAALVVHTEGSSQHMIAARVPADASRVFDSFVRIIEDKPDVEVVNRKDKAMLLEIAQDGFKITAQATQLGAGESLLYIWAEAGDSGRSGRELATAAIETICEELGVKYERVDY
jgi:hypothetical protein